MTTEPTVPAKAAGIVYLTDGRVLLLMRSPNADSNPSTWGLPAGRTEEGESNEQAATRESVEETGHAPSELIPLAADETFASFLCADAFAPVLNEEHTGYLWASIASLPEPCHPGIAEQVAMAWAKTQERAKPMVAADGSIAMDGLDAAFAMDKASVRELDTNGWALVPRNPLSKVGVFTYSGRQVGDSENPDKPYRVYRPAEELSDPECIASFCLIPWIDNHVMLGSEEEGLMPAERKGVQGVIGEDVFFEGDTLYGNLKVFSQSMAGLIEAGKRELSCGYRCVYDFTPGTFRGEAYDCVQRTIRGNHLALVHSGRMGPDVAVLDSIDQSTTNTTDKEPPMADQNGGGSGNSLDEALKHLKTATAAERKAHLTALRAVMDEAGDPDEDDEAKKKAKEAADAEEEEKKKAEEKAAADAAEEEAKKKDAADKAAMDAARTGMDAAEVSKLVAAALASNAASLKRRDALAKQLGPHVGTFDHSDMSEAEVAAYGIKKLGITVPAGQEAAVLQGFLLAAGKTATTHTTKTNTAAMDAGGADFDAFFQGA